MGTGNEEEGAENRRGTRPTELRLRPGALGGEAMIVDVVQESQPDLGAYGSIPIAFDVREIARIVAGPPRSGGFTIDPQPLAVPWTKNYDADGNGPTTWSSRFDLSRWAVFVARVDGRHVGGAALSVIPSGGL